MTPFGTSQAALVDAGELLRYVVDSTDEAIISVSRDGTIETWNRGAARLYGYTSTEAVGQHLAMLDPTGFAVREQKLLRKVFAGISIERFDIERIRQDGAQIVVAQAMTPVREPDGQVIAAALLARDVSERRWYEERLRHLAECDQLTGLCNRRRFEEELKRELSRAGRYCQGGAVLSVDLDNFKSTNDFAGHVAGDAVLSAVARVLKRRFRSGDVVARLGGDEFGILLSGVDGDAARKTAEDLLVAIHSCRPLFGGKSFRITASIGVTTFEGDEATSSELLINADLAMYAAKAAGRDRVVLYTTSEGRRARATAKLTWAERIRDALDRDDGFVLHMQPILDLATDRISHGELLLRMRDEYGNLIAPSAFLPAAERFGLIHAIDRWVVHRAIALIAEGRGAALPVSVNLSGDSVVGDPHLLEMIETELKASSVDPSLLIFEITETAAIANMPEATMFARRVNELGASLALDDFGTGFGSFYYLKHLPVGYVKLDGEFIQNLPQSEVDAHLVNAIVGIAQGLGIKTVAESVTDEETIRLLRSHGVDYAQGFYVGRPVPV